MICRGKHREGATGVKPDLLRAPQRKTAFRWRLLVVVFALSICLGCRCGYLPAGTWENDSENWRRAFGSAPPDGINVVNSWYWRSAYWTLEQEYFFEIEATDEIAQELVSSEGLHRVDGPGSLSGSALSRRTGVVCPETLWRLRYLYVCKGNERRIRSLYYLCGSGIRAHIHQ